MNGKRSKILRQLALVERKVGMSPRRWYRRLKAAYSRGPGQEPKPLRERRHYSPAPIRATWPHTPDQRKQSRPVIVMCPVRAVVNRTHNPRKVRSIRAAGNVLPKRILDAIAMSEGVR